LTSEDPESNPAKLDDASARATPKARHGTWTLTPEALEKLLNHFSPNREEAGRQYNLMCTKLARYFEWRDCPEPEHLADEVIDRVARRIDQGEDIYNLRGYFQTVAQMVFLEAIRPRNRQVPLDDVPEPPAEEPFEDEQKEARARCLDQCLNQLALESRSLILKYYRDEKRAKIDYRKQLAEALGIPLNALRIRAHRVRLRLEECVRNCLAQPA